MHSDHIENKPDKVLVKNLLNDYDYQPESITIKTVLKNPAGSVVLFILDKEQGLIEHAASSEALVCILEGEIDFTISNQNYKLKAGNTLKLPARIPHSLLAVERTKMLLIIV